jgi:ABC-type Co2+ transport system permease subunit
MDMNDLLTRVIKYVVEGVAVALALVFIPRKSLPIDEISTLALVAAAVFAVLDLVSPSIGVTARQGAGFGLGANLVGFPRGL